MASSTTEYLVLRRGEEKGTWHELDGSYHTPGAPKARHMAADKLGEDGEYVAVPTRSWTPEEIRFETVSRRVTGKPGPVASASGVQATGAFASGNSGNATAGSAAA